MRITIPGGTPTPLARIAVGILPFLIVLVLAGGGAPPRPVPGTARGGGLELALSIGSGPYFLSELLPARVTLTNHTAHTIWYVPWFGGARAMNFVERRGGSAPYYYDPDFPMGHVGGFIGQLPAGRTHTDQGLVMVSASGHVTLSALARFYNNGPTFEGVFPPELHPFPPGAASLPILVAPRPPPNRTLRLQRASNDVHILTPPGARPHPLYVSSFTCGGPSPTPATTSYVLSWHPILGDLLAMPSCDAPHRVWQIFVGAPGFAITSAAYTDGA